MVRALPVFAFVALVPAVGSAQQIYKCVSADEVAYQGQPCTGQGVPASVIPAISSQAAASVATANAPQMTPECAPRLRSPPRLPWRQATICIGMTDDEVLNLPGWGRPSKIERSHEQRVWQEVWTYDNGFSRRYLHFANAKLMGIDTVPTGTREPVLASSPAYD